MPIAIANLCSKFRNTVGLVYERVKQMHRPSFILFWRAAVLALYGYLTFTRN